MLTPACPVFEGLLSVTCLTSLWLEIGCSNAGDQAPAKLNEVELESMWKAAIFSECFFIPTILTLLRPGFFLLSMSGGGGGGGVDSTQHFGS